MQGEEPTTNPFQSEYQTPPQYKRVGFGPRIVAYIIDILVAAILVVVLIVLLMQFNIEPTASMQETIDGVNKIYDLLGFSEEMIDMVARLLPALTLAGVIGAISYSLIEGLTGASIGKRIMRLTVATPDGRRGTTMLFIRRWAIKNISSLFDFVALAPTLTILGTFGDFAGFVIFIGCFFALSESKLALHDRIAGTAVFYREDVT